MAKSNKHRIAILSTCSDPWGGSEELWARSIPHLQEKGFEITLLKKKIHFEHPKIQDLKKMNVHFIELDSAPQGSWLGMVKKGWNQLRYPKRDIASVRFGHFIQKHKPALSIIAQGNNFDGLHFAKVCSETQTPYIIICQKAIDYLWPRAEDRQWMQKTFVHAKRCIFVSPQNQVLTEEQFGFRFSNAQTIGNPLKIKPEVLPYPSTDTGFHLACVGRLFVAEKGQDILLRILTKKKWQERNLKITFIGDGKDSAGLKALADLLNVKSVVFSGFKNDIKAVWKEHHALILPSRNEGLPLVIIEAMAAGRMVISTNVGGNINLIEEGKTGFIGDATVESLDSALERAWDSRTRWKQMGIEAYECIKIYIPEFPELEFAEAVSAICNE